MNKNANLTINIQAVGTEARIDIIGNISEWNNNNANDVRMRCQDLKDAGATTCHVYIMSQGGNCFQANEIVNILKELFGSYTGSGGALVASAGTYIAVNASFFENASNGQWLIHKPSGEAYGTETELQNYLKLIQNMTKTYYDDYVAKLKKPEADFKAKWDAGDFWMTAKEAMEWGFVNSIKTPEKVTQAMAAKVKEIGSPIAFANEDIITSQINNNEMDLKAIALTLGLNADASESVITAEIAANAQKAKEYDALKAQVEQKAKTELDAKIKTRLDKAEKDKIITAETRPNWAELLTADYDKNVKLLDSMKPVVALSDGIKSEIVDGKQTYKGKNFEQLQDESPETLQMLLEKEPDTYNALWADFRKRNKV